MNRADVIKLLSQQLQEEVMDKRVTALASVKKAQANFMSVAEAYVLRKNKAQFLYMVEHTGGNKKKACVTIHYQLTDRERGNPSDTFKATIRDGSEWEQTFAFTVQVKLDKAMSLYILRFAWIEAHNTWILACETSTRMKDVKDGAWKTVVDAALDTTDVGREAKIALTALRQELKKDGYGAIATALEIANNE